MAMIWEPGLTTLSTLFWLSTCMTIERSACDSFAMINGPAGSLGLREFIYTSMGSVEIRALFANGSGSSGAGSGGCRTFVDTTGSVGVRRGMTFSRIFALASGEIESSSCGEIVMHGDDIARI